MIINPSLPSGSVVFCDDIRREINGKHTYVGAYMNVMYVGMIPGTIPMISVAVTYRDKLDAEEKVAIRILFEGGDEDRLLAEAEIENNSQLALPPPDQFTMTESHLFFTISPFEIPHEGRVKVRAFQGGNEIRMGSLQILRMPDSHPTENAEN